MISEDCLSLLFYKEEHNSMAKKKKRSIGKTLGIPKIKLKNHYSPPLETAYIKGFNYFYYTTLMFHIDA